MIDSSLPYLMKDLNWVKKGSPWGYQRVMILINDYDGFSDIMVVPLDFVWIGVEIEGLPTALSNHDGNDEVS